MKYLCLIAMSLMAGCNTDIYLRDGVTDGDTFYLVPVASVGPDPARQSWVAYSLAKSVCQLELGGVNPARQSSYDCEFRARNILIDAWVERSAKHPDLSDDYLDNLLAVREAGYLGEYTAYYFRRDHWQVPVDVEVEAFAQWRRQHLHRHRPVTRIIGYWDYRDKTSLHSSE